MKNQENNIIYTVSQLAGLTRELLEDCFPAIWIEGEISNFKLHPPSGHMYFSVKDENAQLRCAMFKMQNRLLHFVPCDGCHVLLRVKVSLYEARGEFQLIVDYMEQSGDGVLLRRFEELKKKLTAEGLFNSEYKKKLPSFAKQIGIITSPSGAAIRDILTTLKRRFPSIPIIIYPAAVQGEEAPAQICKALEIANQRQECDVLILARGGGSLEDLWAFNNEAVARSIFKSHIPVISGIGHETDFTIADFVADQRAPTPTAAAELCSPDHMALTAQFQHFTSRLTQLMIHLLRQKNQTLDFLSRSLIDPRKKLLQQQECLNRYLIQLIQFQKKFLVLLTHKIEQQHLRLMQHNPLVHIKNKRLQLRFHQEQLVKNFKIQLQQYKQKVNFLGLQLHAFSPLITLERGFSIVIDSNNKIIRDTAEVKVDDTVNVRLAKGNLQCKIIDIH